MGPSTLASWACLIARELDDRGIDPEPLFHRAGLSTEHLRNANARYPTVAMQRLWAVSVEATGDPCLGLEVGRRWHPTTFHALGYVALASSSLREALSYLVRYSRIVTTGAELVIVDCGPEVDLVLTSRMATAAKDAVAMRVAVQAGFAAVVTLCREACGRPVSLRRVAFDHTDWACQERLEAHFGCPVLFESGRHSLTFAESDLDAALGSQNVDLVRLNRGLLEDRLAALGIQTLPMRVRAQIARRLPSGGVDVEAVAKTLQLSERNLQRKLQAEGVNFRTLLDDTRRELVQDYLQDETLSSAEIAYLLGFSETSSLSRALRRWRTSPGDAAGVVEISQ
jgi:AraC-like DNA-binding protein